MLKINGADVSAGGMTVSDYLESAGYNTGRVAVEIGGEILPKTKYASTVLEDGAKVEIVSFVGGG